MSSIKITDNFLDKDSFNKFKNFIMGNEFAWHYNPFVDYEDDHGEYFQFTHIFYGFNLPSSSYYNAIVPILDGLNFYSLARVKANLLTKTPKILVNEFHTDESEFTTKQMKQWTTAIFYINTNNGYTEFKDGTIIDSVANRMVTFPQDMKHRGTSCTDEKIRVVINFNYYRK
jgi:hypothetical protein